MRPMRSRGRRRHAAAALAAAATLCASAAAGKESDDATSVTLPSLQEVLEELQALRREQQELRERLSRCGCDGGDGSHGGNASDGAVFRVDVQNSEWLREILFGGQPWLLHCLNLRSTVPAEPPPVFAEAAEELGSRASFGVLDCWQRLPSGKTLAQRFNFPKPPVAFAVANGDPPVVLDLQGLVKPWQLKRKAAPHLAAAVERINSPERFKSYCSSRRACLVVGFKAAKVLADAIQVLQPLLETHRRVRAVSVDTSVWSLGLDDQLKAKSKAKSPSRAEVLCLARAEAGKERLGARLESSAAAGGWDAEELERFLDRCGEGRGLAPLAKAPKLLPRPAEAPKAPKAASKASSSKAASPKARESERSARGRGKGPASGRGSGRLAKAVKGRRPVKKQDVVGSRERLEEQEEPTIVAVEEDESTEQSPEDESADEEEVEL